MATTRPTEPTRLQMRRKAHRLSGHGASSSTVTSEPAWLSANLIRTPSQTRKYGAIDETVSASISPFSFQWTDRSRCLEHSVQYRQGDGTESGLPRRARADDGAA